MSSDQSFLKTSLSVAAFFLIVVGIYTDFLREIPKSLDRLTKINSASVSSKVPAVSTEFEAGGAYISFAGSFETTTVPAVLAPPSPALPVRNWSVPPPELTAESVYVLDGQNDVVLLAKNENKKRPLASLSKIMTAYVAAKNIPLASNIKITASAVSTEGIAGDLVENEELKFEDVLYALLLPSSNDAAEALAEVLGREKFIGLMNEEARALGDTESVFKNPSGLDDPAHYSTAKSIVKLFSYISQIEPIKTIIGKSIREARSTDGKIYHRFVTSNWLLGSYPGVIGGKTGFTDEAGQSLIVKWQPPVSLAVERKDSLPVIYAVVLGSQDRFGDMRAILDWLQEAYHW